MGDVIGDGAFLGIRGQEPALEPDVNWRTGPFSRYWNPMHTVISHKALQQALCSRRPARIHRERIERGWIHGRILAVTQARTALAIHGESVNLNGITVVSNRDITRLQSPDPNARFLEQVLRLRGERYPRLGRLDLTSWQTVVASAAKRARLVTVHVERKDPDVCYIGRPVKMDDLRLTLMTVSPHGVWQPRELMTFAWRDVTRVDYGGGYEGALALIAGPPPSGCSSTGDQSRAWSSEPFR